MEITESSAFTSVAALSIFLFSASPEHRATVLTGVTVYRAAMRTTELDRLELKQFPSASAQSEKRSAPLTLSSKLALTFTGRRKLLSPHLER